MPGLFLFLFASCRWFAPAEPPRSAIAVVVTQAGGPSGLAGQSAVQGVRLAADGRYDVIVFDENVPDLVQKVAANPSIVGVIAHNGAGAVSRMASAWTQSGLPVLTLAAGEGSTLPRLVPDTLELTRCAAPVVVGSQLVLAYDGSDLGLNAVSSLKDALGDRVVDLLGVAGNTLGADAGRIQARAPDTLVFVGGLQLGGDLVRTLRVLKSDLPVVAVGSSAPDFAAAVGSAAGAVLVVSPDRPPLDRAAADAWHARFGSSPSGAGRTAYDTARLLVAAMDAAGETPIARSAVADALRTVEVGTLHLSPTGGPSPILCTGYALQDGALTAVVAGQVDADGSAHAVTLGGEEDAGEAGSTPTPPQ